MHKYTSVTVWLFLIHMVCFDSCVMTVCLRSDDIPTFREVDSTIDSTIDSLIQAADDSMQNGHY